MLVTYVYPQFPIVGFDFGQFYSMDAKPVAPAGQYFSDDVLVAIEVKFNDGDRHCFFCSGYWRRENNGNMKMTIHDTDSNGYDQDQLEACAIGWMPMPPFPTQRKCC